MKVIILSLVIFLVGCAVQTSKPTPMPCEIKVRGECREMSASERGSAVVRGHSEQPKDSK